METSLIESTDTIEPLSPLPVNADTNTSISMQNVLSPNVSTSTSGGSTDSAESLEARYTKIKQYALRLKKALAEKTDEIELLKNESSKKNLSSLQLEYDKTLDENEKLKAAKKTMEKDFKATIEESIKLKETSFQNQAQIQNLTATTIVLKDKLEKFEKSDNDVQKLKSRIVELELELKNTKDSQIDMKQEKRQTAILALEITDYEKKLADLNEKYENKIKEINNQTVILEEKDKKISEHEIQIKERDNTIEDLQKTRDQLQAGIAQKVEKIKFLQDELSKLNEKFNDKKAELNKLQRDYENTKLSFSSESKSLVERCESLVQLIGRHEHKISVLEETRRSLESQVSNLKLELSQTDSEFNNYKLKARARLNSQKPFNATSKEPDELENLQKIVNDFNSEIAVLKSDMQTLKLENENLTMERAEIGLKLSKLKTVSMEKEHSLTIELQKLRQEVRNKELELTSLSEKMKVEREAVVTSYKVQIESMKDEYIRRIKSLEEQLTNVKSRADEEHDEQSSLGSNDQILPSTQPRQLLMSHEGLALNNIEQQLKKHLPNNYSSSAYDQPLLIDTSGIPYEQLRMIPRGECEGSESVTSPPANVNTNSSLIQPIKQYNITFEELLMDSQSASKDESSETKDTYNAINSYKEELLRCQSQVKHLTALLRESESNCERLTQLSEALKEEIRRVERDAGRKEHLKENTEYLKNIILKYASLHGADEKLRLIPVLKTMLKLSPEEVESLESSVRSGGGGSSIINTPSAIAAGLSSLIPRWSPG